MQASCLAEFSFRCAWGFYVPRVRASTEPGPLDGKFFPVFFSFFHAFKALAIHVIQLACYRDLLIPMEAKVCDAFQACHFTLMSSSFRATDIGGLQYIKIYRLPTKTLQPPKKN
jgi:hypothetical protein